MVVAPETDAFVDEIIANHKVVVFANSQDDFSKKAKEALTEELGQTNRSALKVVDIDNRLDCVGLREKLMSLCNGVHTVPRVFIAGKHIGGGMHTVALQKSGELRKLLNSHGLERCSPSTPQNAMMV